MQTSNYFAGQAEQRPCRTCQHYGGPLCRHPQLSPVVGQPENVCAFWKREPGTDDDVRTAAPAA